MKLVDIFGDCVGMVGEKTPYKTMHGEDIHIGDIVKVSIFGGSETIIKPMMKDKVNGVDKYFVMGIEMACNDSKGTIEGALDRMEIVRPYTSLIVGEKIDNDYITVVDNPKEEKKEDKKETDLGAEIFLNILDKAIADLKDAGKDYHGLEVIKMLAVFAEGLK